MLIRGWMTAFAVERDGRAGRPRINGGNGRQLCTIKKAIILTNSERRDGSAPGGGCPFQQASHLFILLAYGFRVRIGGSWFLVDSGLG
jgi:hypothetical protein